MIPTIRMALRQIGKFIRDCETQVEIEKQNDAHRLEMRRVIADSLAKREAEQEVCPHWHQDLNRTAMVWIPDGKYLICQHCQVMKKEDWAKFSAHYVWASVCSGDSKKPPTKRQIRARDAAYKLPLAEVAKRAEGQRQGDHQWPR